jgi:DNA-binding GntR family transcriptional regulator
VTKEAGPEYQRVIGEIRERITSGRYPVGKPIPSTPKLGEEFGVSVTVIRRAVTQLQVDGILEGHPGKGVYVRAAPGDADSERMSVEALSRQVAELREVAERNDPDEIRAAIGRLEANLIELYGKTGHDYPQDGEHDGTESAGRRGRSQRRR